MKGDEKMIDKAQALAKIDELTAYCEANGYADGGYAGYISVLTPAITQYFNSISPELSDNVRDLILKLYNDLMLRDTEYTNPIGKPLPEDYPEGYEDLTTLFDGAGALSEIMSISPATFLAGFPVETTTDEATGTSSTVVLTNPIIAEWTAALSTAHNAEIKGIEAIMTFCERGAFGQDLIGMFEDRGEMSRWKSKEDLAEEIYIGMKVKEVIETFNLDVHVPTYL